MNPAPRGSALRIFLDANILFSAAQSDGAIRRLLRELQAAGHTLVADAYVVAEAERNVAAKTKAGADLPRVLATVQVNALMPSPALAEELLAWLPAKDRPVLSSAIGLQCQMLLTGDRRHFGSGFGRSMGGVLILSPLLLAQRLMAAPEQAD